MKRALVCVALFVVALVWVVPVMAGPDGESPRQEEVGQARPFGQAGKPVDGRLVPPYMPLRDKVMVQRAIQKRAAASRNALMREAQMEHQAQQGRPGNTGVQGAK